MSRFLLLFFECFNSLKFKIIATLFAIFVFDSTFAATWYVNDGSQTGDVYTTAVGNNSNAGTSASAPKLTLQAAYALAAAGDTIYVDSGTYTGTGNVSTTFNKSITIIGAGTGNTILTSHTNDRFGTIAANNVVIQNLQIFDFFLAGAGQAIFVNSNITGFKLTNIVMKKNFGASANGESIVLSSGSSSTFDGLYFSCSGFNGGSGGAIKVNSATLSLSNSVFSQSRDADGKGGALEILGTSSVVTIDKTTFDGNSARAGGAISHTAGKLTVTNSCFNRNYIQGDSSATTNGGGHYYSVSTDTNLNASFTNCKFQGAFFCATTNPTGYICEASTNTSNDGAAISLRGTVGTYSFNTCLFDNSNMPVSNFDNGLDFYVQQNGALAVSINNSKFGNDMGTTRGKNVFISGLNGTSQKVTISNSGASTTGTNVDGNTGNNFSVNTTTGLIMTNSTVSTLNASASCANVGAGCTIAVNCNTETIAPIIIKCVPNKTVAQVNCAATLADYTSEVSAFDDCSFTVTQSPAAGTALTLGDTTVTMTVTDAAGNKTTCTFTVTVSAETVSTKFGDFASAVFINKNGTSAFNNTTGSGANLIGPATFTGQNLGSYTVSSGKLKLAGGEIKTWKNGGNVCSATFYYLIYKTGSRPTNPTFSSFTLPFKEGCSGGSFASGGPCATSDQKWSTEAQNIDLTNYTAGDYSLETYYSYTGGETSSDCSVTQTISNSCNYYKATFTLTSACNISTTATVTNASCKNGNGSATLSSTGGTSPYTYTTSGGTISGDTLTATAGTYTVTTTDANSCTTTTSVTITEPDALTATATAGTIACNGGTTDVSLAISGGTAPYTTLPTTTSGLSAGTYSFEVTDAKGCKVTANVTITQPELPAQPTLACYETATFNSTTCNWDVTGTQPIQPSKANCWDNYTFNTTTCAWVNEGTQPIEPTKANCWDSYTFNTTSCAWENVGTQPTEPSKTNCWDSYTFNTTSCAWENVGTQPTEPSKTNCWDSYTFNTTSCAWENVGTQPTEPSKTNCWDSYTFNTTSCAWENVGTQPIEPTKANCWDSYTFNTTTCAWVNEGTQPIEPTKANCWDNYTFNTTTCAWVNEGTQPIEPSKTNCWDSYTFNTTSCAWENVGTQPTEPSKTNCWDSFTFNTTSCAWENVGTQPTEPSKTNCWDSYTFNTTSCAWENVGTQPTEPSKTNCWDSYTFNTTSCAWENVGTQPTEPSKTNCWDSYTFNTTSCAWENVGTQPTEPSKTNCWDSYTFNTTSCAWENVGTQPTEPSKTNCWDSYTFNTTSCAWENVGTQPTEPSKTNCWDSYTFNTTSCAWENVGTQPTEPSKTNCWDSYTFNTTSCAWENVGTQPTEPSKTNCWDSYTFNTTSCAWENVGTQPTEPSKTNCWDSYTFNTTSCAWENVGTQPTEPSKTNCWDSFTFNTTSCAWENVGTQPAQPTLACYQSATFDTTTCSWIVTGLASNGNLVQNGSFENPNRGGNYGFETMPFWTNMNDGGKIEIHGANMYGTPASKGIQYIELNGNMLGRVYQDVVIEPGKSYTFSFKHRARTTSTETIRASLFNPDDNSNTVVITNTGTNSAWTGVTSVYNASSTQTKVRILFETVTSWHPTYGNFIDDVVLDYTKCFCENAPSYAGTVSSNTKVFAGQSVSKAFTLSNNLGTATSWQVSTSATFDDSNTETFANTTNSFINPNVVNVKSYVRALVKISECSIVPSASAVIDLITCPANGNLVQNGSFENPKISTVATWASALQSNWTNFNDNGRIETWANNFIIPAADGTQLIELNGNMLGRVYQDVVIEPAQSYTFSFKHRARSGLEIVKVTLINPDNNTNSSVYTNTATLGVWKTVTNVYTASATQTKVRILFETVTSPFAGSGNMLDDVKLNYTNCLPINNARKANSNDVEDVVTENQTFTLYPNPTENALFIKTEGLNFTGELKYQIFTVNGVLVRNASYDNNAINVSDLQSGFYIIKFEDQGGFNKSTNFIKK